jgi:hypothetical protein
MQEAARLSWDIHGNGYDDNIRLKYTNTKKKETLHFQEFGRLRCAMSYRQESVLEWMLVRQRSQLEFKG